MTYRECYENGRKTLEAAGIPDADLDARFLLEYVCKTVRHTLLVHGDREVTMDERESYKELTEKRAQHVPLQHLTGEQEFMGLVFRVAEHVLIPRQDTEILVEEVLRELHDGMRVLDLCTGSGCVLISLMKYTNDCEGVGTDISGEALELARENARNILGDGADFRFTCGDLFEGVDGLYDFIVSNPPYIRRDEIDGLMPEVRDYEPREALDGGEDGLDFYRRITAQSKDYLVSGGRLYYEIGCGQAEAVTALMEREGFVEVQVVKDYAGLDRVVYGTWIQRGER